MWNLGELNASVCDSTDDKQKLPRVNMITLMLVLLLAVGCAGKPTEEQLVRECQNRGGTPDIRGPFKCDMPQFAQHTPAPSRYN